MIGWPFNDPEFPKEYRYGCPNGHNHIHTIFGHDFHRCGMCGADHAWTKSEEESAGSFPPHLLPTRKEVSLERCDSISSGRPHQTITEGVNHMSWSFTLPPTYKNDFDAAAKKALEENTETINKYNPDGLDGAKAAVEAVSAIVASGALGDDLIGAALNGHGNPNHRAPAGSFKDTINISVYRATS